MNMFVKEEVLDQANTAYKLIKLDVSKKENLSAPQLVDCGTATKHFLKSNNLPADQKLQFKKSCVAMLVSIVQKLQEKSPLNYAIVRNSRFLSAIVMSTECKVCALQFSSLNYLPQSGYRKEQQRMQNYKCKSFFLPHLRKINSNSKTLMYILNISMIFLEFTYAREIFFSVENLSDYICTFTWRKQC